MKRIIYFFMFLLLLPIFIFSQSGMIDSSFGENGSIIYNDGFVVSNSLIQPDGKIVVTGYEVGIANAVMIRYNEDGSVDDSFNFQSGITSQFSAAFEVKQLSDGQLIVFVMSADDMDDGPFYMNILKINADGSKNVDFNTPLIEVDTQDKPEAQLFMSSNGQPGIVIYSGQSTTGEVKLIRFLENGAFDQTFGPNGERELTVFPNPQSSVSFENKSNALIADDSGNFYFTFRMGDDFYISKTDADFTSFVTQPYSNFGHKYTFYANNSIYNAYSRNYLQKFSSSTLSPDNSYGTNSVAGGNTDSFNYKDSGGFIQPDGKAVVVNAYNNTNMHITRLLEDGSQDVDFGDNGVLNFTSGFPTGYNMSLHYSEPVKKLYIINVDEDNARFMLTRIDLGETETGVKLNLIDKSFIFPTFFTDYINISNEISEISIINLSGKSICSVEAVNDRVSLSHLSSGVYFVVGKDKMNNIYRQKIIKK